MASSRAPAPTPLSFSNPSYTTSPAVSSSDGVSPLHHLHGTPKLTNNQSYPTPPPFHNRSASSGSTDSAASYPFGERKPSSPKNVYTHCGRHTDQYLFGGKGFGDLWKAVTKKE